jgi:hypothetical protein
MLFRVEFEWCVEHGEAEQFVTRLKSSTPNHDRTLLALPSQAKLASVQIEPCDVDGFQFVRAVYRVGQPPGR